MTCQCAYAFLDVRGEELDDLAASETGDVAGTAGVEQEQAGAGRGANEPELQGTVCGLREALDGEEDIMFFRIGGLLKPQQ